MIGNNKNSLWHYRGFVISSVRRDFYANFNRSILGALWSVLNPLMMVLVYTVIFTQIMSARLPGIDNKLGYSIYLCSGIFAWGLFSEIVSRSQVVFLENANLIKKIKFPVLCLPAIIVTTALINFAIVMTLFLGALLVTGNFPGISLIALIPIVLAQIFFSISLGMTVGILNVFFRDVGQLFSLLLTLWFWATPIIYPISILPDSIATLVQLNPLTSLVGSYQTLFLTSKNPPLSELVYPFTLGVFFLLISWKLYQKHGHEIVDEI